MESYWGSACHDIFSFHMCFCSSIHKCGVEDILLLCSISRRVTVSHWRTRCIHSLTFNRETAADENATSYFPLLDRIADGYFSKASTEKELYDQFVQLLKDDGHMQAESLSSYKFALSMRSLAPRIEAHYQYYHTAAEPSLKAEQDTSCPVWVLFDGKQYCSPSLKDVHGDVNAES